MKRLLAELKEFKVWIIIAFIGIIAATTSDILLPMLFAKIVNIIGENSASNIDTVVIPYIKSTGKIMILIVLFTILGATIGNFFTAKVSAGMAKKLRGEMFSKVQTFSQTEMGEFTTGSLITRNTNDINQLQQFIGMFIRMFVRAPIIMLGSIFMAYKNNPRLASPLLFAVPIIIVIVFLISKIIVPKFTKLQEGIDKINLVLREQITGVRVVRAFTNEKHDEKRFNVINKDQAKLSLSTFRIMALMSPLLTIVLNLTVVSVLFLAARDINNNMPIVEGDIIAVIQYVTQILFAFIMLSMIFVMYPRAEASATRVFEVIDTIPIVRDLNVTGKVKQDQTGTIEFKNVSFCFPEADKPVLEGINLKIESGSNNAIIGSTGSGKTTLLRLILRFYDVTQGAIFMDGVDVRELAQQDIRNRVGYVPQSSQLFSGTIADNIKFADKDSSGEEMIKAAKISQSLNFINEKEGGFSAEVEKGGANFSGGQKQRLSIARAIAKTPEFYLLDDSFSALDAATDKKLRNALDIEAKGSTRIVVSQRVASIMDSDNIIVLDNGKIVGQGTHQQLIESCSIYKEIAESQFSQEEVAI